MRPFKGELARIQNGSATVTVRVQSVTASKDTGVRSGDYLVVTGYVITDRQGRERKWTIRRSQITKVTA